MSNMPAQETPLLGQLSSIVGEQNLLSDHESRQFFSQDVYSVGPEVLAVVQPENAEQLAAAVAATTTAGFAAIPRGGGMSYTSGYVPSEPDSVMFDLRRMNRVLEINKEDMYVRVEAGCTWKDLHEALKDTGLRTPFWGTLSGIKATVGGGLSQNSIFWGSGQFGSAVDSVVGLEVVLADGSILKTGAAGQTQSVPFFRHYGPDLTGLFTCDTGALGFKAVVSLKLIPQMEAREYASFDFEDYPGLVAAISEISRRGLAMELFAFDPYLQAQRLKRESLARDIKALGGVLKASGSVMGALKDGAKIAMSGRRFMKDVDWSLHATVEQSNEAAAAQAMRELKEICERNSGKEIENNIPKILRANPFTPLNNVLGPEGERWAPIHVIVPHSRAKAVIDDIEKLVEERMSVLEEHGIGFGYLLATIAHNGFVVEPVFFWPDEIRALHLDTLTPDIAKRMPNAPANPESSAVVEDLREQVKQIFSAHGGVHLQIGKAYPYRQDIDPVNFRLIESIKRSVDPDNRINPGSLGLQSGSAQS